MGKKLQDVFVYYGPWQPERLLPSTTCFFTKIRLFTIPWLALVSSEPNISHIYTPILGIASTLYAYEDGTDSKFRNVGIKSSDAGRLPKRHKTAFNHGERLK
jgi:hypothetical protein